MARRERLSPVDIAQHIVQRGNNRQVCFTSDEDMAAYANWLAEGAKKYSVLIHAWVFMTNHVHLLATPTEAGSVSRMMQYVGRHYVPYFNYSYKRSGTLWEGRFKSSLVEAEQYLLICQRYIELNPVRAGMVDDPADYKWSSYQTNALGVELVLCTPHSLYLAMGRTVDERSKHYRSLFESHIEGVLITSIRDSLNQGLVLGEQSFREQVEKLTGKRASLIKRGPKPKRLEKNKAGNEFLL